MDFDEHEDQEEMEIPVSQQPNYDSIGNVNSVRSPARKVRYRECLKNHAVGIGGHALDGCGEFMAAGQEGTIDALKCAACNCHRNFHRKETEGEVLSFYHHHQFSPYYRAGRPPLHLAPPLQHRPLALPAASGGGAHSRDEEDMSNPSSSGGFGSGSGGSKKRFRTKFTQEQKDKMLGFAERLGWRIQKHDDAAVEQFCVETGIKRHVLKVWMHNNKHTLEKFQNCYIHKTKKSKSAPISSNGLRRLEDCDQGL